MAYIYEGSKTEETELGGKKVSKKRRKYDKREPNFDS